MIHSLRVVGWLLLGMGLVLSGVVALGLLGAFPLDITVSGRHLAAPRERVAFLVVWSMAAVAGLALVQWARWLESRSPTAPGASGHTA